MVHLNSRRYAQLRKSTQVHGNFTENQVSRGDSTPYTQYLSDSVQITIGVEDQHEAAHVVYRVIERSRMD